MKSFIATLLLPLLCYSAIAQDTTITLSPGVLITHDDPNAIWLPDTDGWLFRQGNDTAWADKNINTTGWEKRKPSELSEKLVDKNGKLECWLRIKIKPDTSFRNTRLGLFISAWAATDVYIDGTLVATFGDTGTNGKPFKEHSPAYDLPVDLNIEKGVDHTLAIHFVDFISPLPPHHLRSSEHLKHFIAITLPAFKTGLFNNYIRIHFYQTMVLSVNLVLCLLFWLLALQNAAEKNLLLIALASTGITMLVYCGRFQETSYTFFLLRNLAIPILISAIIILGLIIMLRTFRRKITLLSKVIMSIIFICGIAELFFENLFISESIYFTSLFFEISLAVLVYAYYISVSWKTLKGAQWAVLTGIVLTTMFGLSSAFLELMNIRFTTIAFVVYSAIYLSSPLSLLVYVAMRFQEIIKEVRHNAQQIVQLSEEKKQRALNQQKVLQEEVNKQTAELRSTLENLKATQSQLIQSEKMASLGELTAGIAHEIQNPLNFVNNFSEVNNELISELVEEVDKENYDEVKAIANDIKENEQKINLHGKRADAIVKGMLQHSKASTGKKELTDINALCDEYLRLSYHGMRAKDKSFNAELKTDFDESIGKINIVPQDIGRVLLNLFNNAFYAVNEKIKLSGNDYKPTVSIQTKRIAPLEGMGAKVEIIVRDNGGGIPQNVVDKIFQPFFTTKPTGQGTGLGLSLVYDIIKAHGGEIKVETLPAGEAGEEGGGSEFVIRLPE